MRYVFAVLALLMAACVVVQYNDPDGPIWMLYYGVPAIWAGLAALHPPALVTPTGRLLLALSVIAALALTFWYWPPVAGFWHEDVWTMGDAAQGPEIAERSREGMGMMTVTVVLLVVAAGSNFARKGNSKESAKTI